MEPVVETREPVATGGQVGQQPAHLTLGVRQDCGHHPRPGRGQDRRRAFTGAELKASGVTPRPGFGQWERSLRRVDRPSCRGDRLSGCADIREEENPRLRGGRPVGFKTVSRGDRPPDLIDYPSGVIGQVAHPHPKHSRGLSGRPPCRPRVRLRGGACPVGIAFSMVLFVDHAPRLDGVRNPRRLREALGNTLGGTSKRQGPRSTRPPQ